MTRPHFLVCAIATAVVISLATLALVTPGTPALALGSPSVSMELLDTTPIAGATTVLVDSASHRGYLLDKTAKSVLVYDLSGLTLAAITTIPTTLMSPISMAIDERNHRLIVGDIFYKAALIDIDPSSPTANGVLQIFATGGDIPAHLAIDGNTVFAGDFQNTTNLSRIDLRDGSITRYDVGGSTKSVSIDPNTHIAYVGLPTSAGHPQTRIAAIDTSGEMTVHSVSVVPRHVLAVDGGLLVSTDSTIIRYDTTTWNSLATSPVLGSILENGFAQDPKYGTVYVASASSVRLLDSQSLAVVGTLPTTNAAIGVAVDTSNHRVLALGSGNAEMWAAGPSVERVSGADRYEVSAAISRGKFSAPAPVVYVASGAVFSDALSASAAAGAQGGPVLLVQKDRIPAAVAVELGRLQPARIVVLGGMATIDASVETALAAYSPNVKRIGGADRFEVSAALSQDTFGTARPVAYVAAGATFPDALSGSAASGRLGGPVLLTAKDSLPTSIDTELRRLAPVKIVVLGGTASVSQAVVDALTAIQANTVRTDGADRFEVSAAVSATAFPANTNTVYVASGLVYPDALSGSAAAIATGSPVLLVTRDSIPASVATELIRLKPGKIVLLGGPNSVSTAVETELKRYIIGS